MLLSPGTETTVRRDEGYMPEFLIPLSGQKVQIIAYTKWQSTCDSRVWQGLSHYHVMHVPPLRSPSGLARRFCVPAAYVEPTKTRTEA